MAESYPVDFYEKENDPNRRVLKTHLPVNLLPQELLTLDDHKMIYTARNPKDAAISLVHHLKHMLGHYGSFEDILDGFLTGDHIYGSYFRHVEEYLRVSKVKKNLLLITYEDMVSDMAKVVKQVAVFLDIKISDSDVDKVADYVHFDQMKNRTCSNFQEMVDNFKSTNDNNNDFRLTE